MHKPAKQQVPSKSDWGNYERDLDQKHAYEIFNGHTNKEVREYYLDDPLGAAEDLHFMPRIPFQYYMLGFADAVHTGTYDPRDIADAATCFLKLVIAKLKSNKSDVLPLMDSLLPAIEYVANHQKKYQADIAVYGDFKDRLRKIKKLM